MALVLDAVIILILLIAMFLGYRRGFIQTMLQLAVWIVSFAVAMFFSSPIAGAVFDGVFAEKLESGLCESLQATDSHSSSQQWDALLEKLPDPVSSFLKNDAELRDTFDTLSETDNAAVEAMAHSVVTDIVRPVAVTLLRFIVFLILFVVLLFALRLVKKLLKPVSRIPIIRQADGTLGAVLGACKGAICVFAVVAVLQIVVATSSPDAAITQKTIEDTQIVSWIADCNPLTTFF